MTLEPRGYVESYRGKVTAHPKLDPETGEMVWFGYSTGDGAAQQPASYGVTDKAGGWCAAMISRRRSPAWCTTSW